jgi:uncharacterized membrane protein
MPKLTYAENPVHPVLNTYPAALVPASLACDLLYTVTRRPSFRNASQFALMGALGTGIAAAWSGFQDYQEIPEGTDLKRMANMHAMLNVGMLGAVGLSLVMRATGKVSATALLLNMATTAGIVASGWYGAHMVYRHGMRVHGVDPIADAPEFMEDTGKPMADKLEQLLEQVPDHDLSGYAMQAGEQAQGVLGQAQETLDKAAREAQSRAEEIKRSRSGEGETATTDASEQGREDPLLDVAATSRMELPDEPAR